MLCDYYAKRGWDDKGIPNGSRDLIPGYCQGYFPNQFQDK